MSKNKEYVKLKSQKILKKKEAIDIFKNKLKPELKRKWKSLWGQGKTWLHAKNLITIAQLLKW